MSYENEFGLRAEIHDDFFGFCGQTCPDLDVVATRNVENNRVKYNVSCANHDFCNRISARAYSWCFLDEIEKTPIFAYYSFLKKMKEYVVAHGTRCDDCGFFKNQNCIIRETLGVCPGLFDFKDADLKKLEKLAHEGVFSLSRGGDAD